MNRHELLAIVAASWQALDAAIDGLDDRALAEAGVVGPWSVTEVLGHVTAWDQQALRHIEQWQRGEPLTTVGGPAVDDYNAAEAARRQGWSLEQVRAEHQATRQRLQSAFETASDADWSSRWLYHGLHSLDFPWLYNYRPLWDVVVITFMVGGTALCVTSLVLAWRVLGRKVRALVPQGRAGSELSEDLA